ncbi:MAG: tRNA (adenosine(37)-N6)-threonylcarbamoyltransferase complex ATPase subunit type 1 TsaE [Deltaproteobacteria bacterium]|nr:tRNA (adenosine(37)-N6)-threonylcarbamoyltransferase complex ATPase subunit type 1 TsaE [Deltaproteobacteria bacterium]
MPRRRLRSAAATRALGERLGQRAEAGAVFALVGALGAGKTLLAGGIGAGLGVRGPVASPTFVLCMLHEDGRLPFAHVDLYRVAGLAEAEAAGLLEAIHGRGVCAVEWADRVPDLLPADHLWVEIRPVAGRPNERDVILRATGPRHAPFEAVLHG